MPRQLKPADPAEAAAALDRVRPVLAGAGAGDSDSPAAPEDLRLLVRHYLARLSQVAPGNSVEVRIPPYAAIQCVPGPRHTRGTPPGVVETDPVTWIRLAIGELSWAEAVDEGRLIASGERTDLSAYLPL
ncbi:sterol carrier family protein [Flindersiella endophytica]